MTGGVAQTFHSVFSYDFVRQQGDPFPFPCVPRSNAPPNPTRERPWRPPRGPSRSQILLLEWEEWRLLIQEGPHPGEHSQASAWNAFSTFSTFDMEGEITFEAMALEEFKAFHSRRS